MALKEVNWGTLLVVVPLGHLVVVSLYLWSWYVGFGAHASMLADARDVFSLSISEMVPIYILGLVLPGALTVHRYTWKHPTAQARLAAISDPEVRAVQSRSDDRMRKIVIIGAALIGLQSAFATVDLFMRGQPTTGVVFGIIYFFGGALLWVVWKWDQLSNTQWETLLVVAALVFSATSNGISAGQLDRHRTFEASENRYLGCGETVVVRRLGEHLVGILPNNEKVVTDLECNVVMQVPSHRVEHERVLRWRFPFFNYVPRSHS